MNGIDTAKVTLSLIKLKAKPRPERLTARRIVETFRGQIESMINEHYWTVLDVMEALVTASETDYSPYTLKNAWFKMLREEREAAEGGKE